MDWYDVKVLGSIFVIMVCLLVVLGLPFAFAANAYESWKCGNVEKISGIETKYIYFDSCYAKTDSGWARWEDYVARQAALNGLKYDK